MRFKPLAFLLLAVGVGNGALGAQAPEPEFDLIGSATEKLTYAARDWQTEPTAAWALTADLKPRFTYGPASFQADTNWALPLSANLAPGTPGVSVYEAYFRIRPTDSLDLTFGQKRLALGVGQTFTVGDSLNPVVGFFDQKTGFRGVTAEWSPVSWASVSTAVSTEGSRPGTVGALGHPGGAVQLSLLLDQLQVTASTIARQEVSLNPALGVSYDLFGVILTAEGAVEFLPQGLRPSGPLSSWKAPEAWKSPALSGSAGARWTPTLGDWDLTLSAEYLHWAQGWNQDETDAWKAAATLPGPPFPRQVREALPLRSQKNLFLRLALSTGGAFTVSAFAAVDGQDGSVLSQGSVVWAPWDNLDLTATLQAVSGQAGTSWEFLNANKDRFQASFATTYHF